MARAGRRILIATVLLVGLSGLAATGLSQVMDDPRNLTDYDAVNGGDCYSHHEDAGFVAMGYSFKQRYSQLPIGEVVPIEVVVRHTSKLVHTIQSIAVVINISQAPNIQVISENMTPPLERTLDAVLANAQEHVERFAVIEGASEVYVGARLTGTPTGSDLPIYPQLPKEARGTLTVTIGPSDGRQREVEGPSPFFKQYWADREAIVQAGVGDWRLGALWQSDVDSEMAAQFTIMVNYTTTQTEFTFRNDERLAFQGASTTVTIPVIIQSEEEGLLDFRVQSVAYWGHRPSDAAPRDDGLFYRWMTMKVRGGDSLSLAAGGPVGPGPVNAVDIYNLMTRLLGFVALILVPVSMVTGGLFGKSSRRALNKLTGGAKKRVLWHSAMSFMIIGVASIHFLVAIIESTFIWTKGLLWGGVGWFLLISLGFTGYYQVRMIKRWNYRVWRHTHLWTAVGVFAFGIFHMVLDGSDLAVLRDWQPWMNRIIWP